MVLAVRQNAAQQRDVDEAARMISVSFSLVYLIDDFTASGTTFIRFSEGKPKGKLAKFEQNVQEARKALKGDFPLADGYTLHIHHYVSTAQRATRSRDK